MSDSGIPESPNSVASPGASRKRSSTSAFGGSPSSSSEGSGGDIDPALALPCPNCHEPLQEPRVLQCGHSVCEHCEKCLKKEGRLAADSIICPKCGKRTLFSNLMKQLPVNHGLIGKGVGGGIRLRGA